MSDQTVVFLTLAGALALFIWGRFRYDLVALLALLAVVLAGATPAREAFAGFGHPAVVTVAAVLVVSRALFSSGVVDLIASWMRRLGPNPSVQVTAMTALVAICSAFMNNVGALALMMPVAVRLARRSQRSPGYLLMPVAFGSLLGGLMTLIGTPPNIIIATFRAEANGATFGMFDFTPVGGIVALGGVLFVGLVGWRLIPHRASDGGAGRLFRIQDYTTEVRLGATSRLQGVALRDLRRVTDAEVVVLGLIRGEQRLLAPSSYEVLHAGDVLIVEATDDALEDLVKDAHLELLPVHDIDEGALASGDVSVMEAVVRPDAPIVGRTVRELDLRWRYGLNLVAISRQGSAVVERLVETRFRPGDVLLLQGRSGSVRDALAALGCLPLAIREFRLAQSKRLFLALAIFLAALLVTAGGLAPVQIAFAGAVAALLITECVSLDDAYRAIDWPVIVLLGAMIPVGSALETTGGAQLIADTLLHVGDQLPPAASLAMVLIGTMLLTDVINNAAAAVLMAPIAISVAKGLGVSADPMLMAVAIGASCAFLTPIGHQSNTLVMGPGGYRFSDYWRMGLPLAVVVAAIAIPMILWVWPF